MSHPRLAILSQVYREGAVGEGDADHRNFVRDVARSPNVGPRIQVGDPRTGLAETTGDRRANAATGAGDQHRLL